MILYPSVSNAMFGQRKASYMFDRLAHSGFGDTTTAKDLNSVAGRLLCCLSGVLLQKGDRSVANRAVSIQVLKLRNARNTYPAR